jgi:superfamily I DNA/RNA helicase
MRRLDSAQLAAATGRASIQLTLAGPGSGKTSTLTGQGNRVKSSVTKG